jgi:hypothetical protein
MSSSTRALKTPSKRYTRVMAAIVPQADGRATRGDDDVHPDGRAGRDQKAEADNFRCDINLSRRRRVRLARRSWRMCAEPGDEWMAPLPRLVAAA